MTEESEQATANIMTGIVKWFNVKHGYGFITKEGSDEDIFVHQTAIIKNNPKKYLRSVGDGETVEFIVIQGTKGPEAAQVTGPNGSPVQGSKYAPDRRQGRSNYRRRYPPRGPRPTTQDSQGEDKNDNSDDAEAEHVDRRRPRGPRRRFRRRPRGPPKDDSQTQEDGHKDDSASAPAPYRPRRRNYRPRPQPSNEDVQDQQVDGEEGQDSPPRRSNYRGRYRGNRTFRPRPPQQQGDGDVEDGDEQPRPPRRRRYRPRRQRQNQPSEEGGNQDNQEPPAEESSQQKD